MHSVEDWVILNLASQVDPLVPGGVQAPAWCKLEFWSLQGGHRWHTLLRLFLWRGGVMGPVHPSLHPL